MATISLTATAVAFLGTDVAAQRLTASWGLLAAAMAERPGADRDATWAELSGVPLIVAQKLGAVLRQHGLVRDGGVVADEAVAVLNALAARKLKELRK